jgi:hypothetical protein
MVRLREHVEVLPREEKSAFGRTDIDHGIAGESLPLQQQHAGHMRVSWYFHLILLTGTAFSPRTCSGGGQSGVERRMFPHIQQAENLPAASFITYDT